jgi:hypothetical protein
MGFFNFLETAFFISLAITFILIMMLVYHFKGRIVILEQKCDPMFEIMNNMIKELKSIQARSIASAHAAQNASVSGMSMPAMSAIPPMQQFSGGLPMDFFSMLSGNGGNMFSQNTYLNEEDGDDEEDEDDEHDEQHKKIVVSDTEVDSDDEDDDEKVKIINVDISEMEVTQGDLPELEEVEPEESIEDEADGEEADSLDKQIDYKKMDISYLRTLVITRGLASDTKKLKKADLVKLLSDE